MLVSTASRCAMWVTFSWTAERLCCTPAIANGVDISFAAHFDAVRQDVDDDVEAALEVGVLDRQR